MGKDNQITEVLFRLENWGDGVWKPIAFFPYEFWSIGKGGMPLGTCYQSIGQHSGFTPEYIKETRKASPAEYKRLLIELYNYGYNLRIIKRVNWSRCYKTLKAQSKQ